MSGWIDTAPYGYATVGDAALDTDDDDWNWDGCPVEQLPVTIAAERSTTKIALRTGNEVVGIYGCDVQVWMVECESCGMLSESHFCDGRKHPVGWRFENVRA